MLDDYVRHHAQLHPNSIAIIRRDGTLPFWKFEADIRRAVHELGELKVDPGQSVSVSVSPPYLDWVLNMALARLAIASAPAADVESDFHVTDDEQRTGRNVLLLSPEQKKRVLTGPERGLVQRHTDPESLARIFRTSGTTGEPKRMAISWRALASSVMETVAWGRYRRGPWWATTGIDTPAGYYFALAATVCRYPAVIGLGPSPEAILKIKPRLVALVPIHAKLLLDNLPAGFAKWRLALLNLGGALSPNLLAQLRDRLTSDVHSAYGASETGPVSVIHLALLQKQPFAAGYTMPGVQVRLLDERGAEVPPGELGLVCVSSEKVAMGYPDDAEGTARHFRDGWFHSSDLGRLREDGMLFLEGRADEVMNLGGHKILPGTIDAAIGGCAGVKEAAAFAFADRRGVDRCGIAVVAGEGFDVADLHRAAATKMRSAQRSAVMLIDEIPRNAMGKVERLKLREMMEARERAEP